MHCYVGNVLIDFIRVQLWYLNKCWQHFLCNNSVLIKSVAMELAYVNPTSREQHVNIVRRAKALDRSAIKVS